MALNHPHPMLVVAWVVARTRSGYGWLMDRDIARHFHAAVSTVRDSCNLGVEMGFLRKRTLGTHVMYGFEPDEEAAFWKEADFLDRHGLLKDSTETAEDSSDGR